MAEAANSEDGNRDESAAIVIRREKKKRRGGEEERDDNESAVGNISCRTLWNLQRLSTLCSALRTRGISSKRNRLQVHSQIEK